MSVAITHDRRGVTCLLALLIESATGGASNCYLCPFPVLFCVSGAAKVLQGRCLRWHWCVFFARPEGGTCRFVLLF
jgi:hypothetical protein